MVNSLVNSIKLRKQVVEIISNFFLFLVALCFELACAC
jgi:hypothetical protein